MGRCSYEVNICLHACKEIVIPLFAITNYFTVNSHFSRTQPRRSLVAPYSRLVTKGAIHLNTITLTCRLLLSAMFFTEKEVLKICEFNYQHSMWKESQMCLARTSDNPVLTDILEYEARVSLQSIDGYDLP